jgi:hypothetical protein
VAKQVVNHPETLEMNSVHDEDGDCGTTHCAAGWICTISPEAKELEQKIGWNAAACLACPVPEFTSLFYSENKEMMDFAKSVLADNGAALLAKYGLSHAAD